MHMAELLVSHGASLNAKTFLEETPIGIFTPQHSYKYKAPNGGVKKTNVSSQQGLISILFTCFTLQVFPLKTDLVKTFSSSYFYHRLHQLLHFVWQIVKCQQVTTA